MRRAVSSVRAADRPRAKARLRASRKPAAISLAAARSAARSVAPGSIGRAAASTSARMPRTTNSSMSVNPAVSGAGSPIGDILIFPGAAGSIVGAQGVEVVFAVLARYPVDIGVAPRIDRNLLLLQIGSAPTRHAARRLDKGLQAFLLGRIVAHIEPVEIERPGDILDLDTRGIGACAAQVFHDLWCDEADQQAKNGEHDE